MFLMPICLFETMVPKMKGEEMYSVRKQLLKVREEVDEAIQASQEQYIEELGDLIHSVIVLTRVMAREGISPERALERVVEKNRWRGYYDESQTA